MIRIFRHYVSPVKLSLAIADFVTVYFTVLLAEWLRYELAGFQFDFSTEILISSIVAPIVIVPVLLGVGAYETASLRDVRIFLIRLTAGLLGAAFLLSAILFLIPNIPLWRSILVITFVLSGVFLIVQHWLFTSFVGTKTLGRRVIVLGAGKEAAQIHEMTGRAADAGLTIVSTVALAGDEVVVSDSIAFASIPDFETYAQQEQAELIIVASDANKQLPAEDLIACKLSGIAVQDRLSFYEQVRGYVDLNAVNSEWIIFSEGFKGGSGLERFVKRFSDIVVSSIALIVFLPFMVCAGIAVAVTSRGPIFYLQERVGLKGHPFFLMKFRSMTVDAEKAGQPEWAKEFDPRVTLVGRFLRRTRIDELPQVINVLKGDMSFVGPRPERPFFVNQLIKEIPFYKERHCLKPGITGWAQIQYPYGASFEDSKRKLEYDLYYIKNYSVFLDLLIILQTIRVILFPHGVR